MIFQQHELLVAHVLSGDADGAVAVMESHLRTAFLALERIASDHADFFEDTPHPVDATPPISTTPDSEEKEPE
jgi:hypothetical protein